MFNQIISSQNIEAAYFEVVNRFAEDQKEFSYHGLDNLRLCDHEMRLDELLSLVNKELRQFTSPNPALRLMIPKKNKPNSYREISVFSIKDRIKAQAITRVLLPRFEASFSSRLFSYRPGYPPDIASRQLARRYKKYFKDEWALVFDISDYSGNINPIILRDKLALLFPEKGVIELLELFIFNSIYDQGVIKKPLTGVISGVPLVSLFCNFYLSDVDIYYERRLPFYARVGDDFALMSSDKDSLALIRDELFSLLASRGLSIEPSKVFFGPAEKPFAFLGYSFIGGSIGLEQGFINKHKNNWKRLLAYKHRSLAWKQRFFKKLMKSPIYNFNRHFKQIIISKPQINNTEQIKSMSEDFFKIMTEFFFVRYTPQQRRKLKLLLGRLKITSLYRYYQKFHYGKH